MTVSDDLGVLYAHPDLARFFKHVSVGDCWEWTASRDRRVPYGRFRVQGRLVVAHRWLYEQLVRRVRQVEQLDHLCRNPPCVNPDHLQVVTPKENIRRSTVGLHELSKTHCPRGHEYDYVRPNGWRGCRTCNREWAREHRR